MGVDARRVAEIIVERCDGSIARGSGYLVGTGRVLTVRHVLDAATGVRVRFNGDRPDERTEDAAVLWPETAASDDTDSDLAVLAVPTHHKVGPASFGRIAESGGQVPCETVGFPLFRMRDYPDGQGRYRDSHHARGHIAPLSNRREGTWELVVSAPPRAPDPLAEGRTQAEQLAARAERSRFAFLAKRRRTRLAGMVAKLTDLNSERDTLTQELKTLNDGMTARWADAPAVMSAASAVRASHQECRALIPPALEAARFVHAVVARVGASLGCPDLPIAPNPDRVSVTQISDEVTDFTTWLLSALPILRARADLLTAWRDDAAKESAQLYPELIRYADVIAATCSGAATEDELGDIDVDLTIIDEAGQIGLPDALVPLVRAKRAVLVGDDRQLPPFLKHDVQQWGEEKADPQVLSLLTKSALELLVDDLPPANIVQLTRQRRMPADVCAFISARFYRGLLTTEGERPYHDRIFTRPMAFVETTYLPEQARRERTGGPREAWNVTGTSNPAEAELLAELAAFYRRGGADWAVIVPYRAQVALVTEKIAERLHDIDTVRHNVGTVDSFQGGERDVILYGFTRSNRQGEVGFLRELRRINVALSRVRRQLVMVGDARTLSEARDPGFRELAEALRQHLMRRGEVREYSEILSLVRKLADQGGEG